MYIEDCFSFPQIKPSEGDLFTQAPDINFFKDRKVADWFNLALFHHEIEQCDDFIGLCKGNQQVGLSVLVSLKSKEWRQRLERLEYFDAIVVHPYLQNITERDVDCLVNHLMCCAKTNLPIFVCTAIGSAKMYKVWPLKIASIIAEKYEGPVVLCHGGGLKVLDAMLIAQSYDNVFIDTSFSLPFWQGSSIEGDIAFAMKKIGVDRWLYGSDSPYVSETEAINTHLHFFDKYNFTQNQIEQVMGRNSTRLFGR